MTRTTFSRSSLVITRETVSIVSPKKSAMSLRDIGNGTKFERAPVCTENSNPYVMMVKPAEDRVRTNDSDPLNRAKNRRILVQRPMRSDGVVVSGIGN